MVRQFNVTNKIIIPSMGETTFVEMIEPSNTPPSFAPIKTWNTPATTKKSTKSRLFIAYNDNKFQTFVNNL